MKLRTYPYKEIAINSAFLEIPAEYQRKLQMSKVKQMVAEFNGIVVNPPKVSYREGRYIVIDGQHTIVGLKVLNGGEDLSIVCRVYTGLTKEEKEQVARMENRLSTIARQGRAFGIHLFLSTQRPDANILSGQIKNNIGYRICGRADNVLSMIILDNTDASDKIPHDAQGRFLTGDGTVFQAYWFDDTKEMF